MSETVADLIDGSANRYPSRPALTFGEETLAYAALADRVAIAAGRLVALGIGKGERVAVYLDKRIETIVAMFGAAAAGAVFVPVNPLLRPRQIAHILKDCNVRLLVTTESRLGALAEVLPDCHDLHTVVITDGRGETRIAPHIAGRSWDQTLAGGALGGVHRVIDMDMAAIFYTSGSTGMPKGVVLSHRNIVAGARSVSQYLENTPEDSILSVLPLSFDAGFSQLSTAFNVGARVVLMNYLLPQDVAKVAGRERITGLAGVPPLWAQLVGVPWPEPAIRSLRYFTNTGGHMPRATLDRLRALFPTAAPFLMYGLTEAFRSTYLPPTEVDRRPDSIGKAIPNAEILVVREDGTLCGPNEPGELVHRGALVSLGYWNDPERTAQRFKPAPQQPAGLTMPEMAVWSGDTVRRDEEGYLYFIGRRDEMIKTSGYRVSPTEVEEVVYASGLVGEAVALGVPHPVLGAAIVVVATAPPSGPIDAEAVLLECKRQLPPFMVPHAIVPRTTIERNPNGKFDRKKLADDLADLFAEAVR